MLMTQLMVMVDTWMYTDPSLGCIHYLCTAYRMSLVRLHTSVRWLKKQ